MTRSGREHAGGYRYLRSAPSAWPALDPTSFGMTTNATDTGDLLAAVLHDWRGEGFLTYHRYQQLNAWHDQHVVPLQQQALADDDPRSHRAARAAFLDCARQVAMTLGIAQPRGEGMLQEAVDLITRLLQIAYRLRDGVISLDIATVLIRRTDLILDQATITQVDAAIAAELDRGHGAWSEHHARDLADRIVFRSEPDAVRARRDGAKQDRHVRTRNLGDGMGLLATTMTGERLRISVESIRALAATVCPNDPRTTPQRNSDAVFALLNQLAYECGCGDPATCTATTIREREPGTALVPIRGKAVVHVVADKATVDGRASNPGFMDGYGVVSGDHIQDLIDDPTTVVSPLGPDDELAVFLDDLNTTDSSDETGDEPDDQAPESSRVVRMDRPAPHHRGAANGSSAADGAEPEPAEAEPTDSDTPADPEPDGRGPQPLPSPSPTPSPRGGAIMLPAAQPHNPYRPSSMLDLFVRIRDGYTLIPGNPQSAFHCDLDHWQEFNHADPAAGGLTDPHNLGAKDRFGHNLKTHGAWVDDLIIGPDGRVTPIFITPGRIVIEGRAGPGLDLFPGLARYRFTPPMSPQPSTRRRRRCQPRSPLTPPTGRTADKHAYRQAERERNRAARATGRCINPPAVQKLITARQTEEALGDPPF